MKHSDNDKYTVFYELLYPVLTVEITQSTLTIFEIKTLQNSKTLLNWIHRIGINDGRDEYSNLQLLGQPSANWLCPNNGLIGQNVLLYIVAPEKLLYGTWVLPQNDLTDESHFERRSSTSVQHYTPQKNRSAKFRRAWTLPSLEQRCPLTCPLRVLLQNPRPELPYIVLHVVPQFLESRYSNVQDATPCSSRTAIDRAFDNIGK